jgi:large subunit ribosomal protein L29
MKKKEFEQLKTKPTEELNKNLKEYRDKLWSLKTDLVAGKVKNVKEIKHVKKIIAKLLTLINQKI